MTLYIYADETEFDLNDEEKIVGSGVFICKSSIENVIVENALENLRNDSDITNEITAKHDQRTLERGYFHACEDSKNSHSHFCRSIVTLNGNFEYSYFNPSKDKPWRERSLQNLQELTLKLSSIGLFYTKDKIVFNIERRNDFGIDKAEKWIEELYKLIELSIFRDPSNPSFFPNIEIKIAGKENPGLQVTDFILWSLNRHTVKPSHDDWFERLGLMLDYNYSEDKWPLQGGAYILKNKIEFSPFKYPSILIEKPKSSQEVREAYLLIERFIRYISKKSFPDHALHLKEKTLNIYKRLINEPTNVELIRETSSTFIRLFDTFPLYNDLPLKGPFTTEDKNKWSKLLIAREISSISLNRRNGNAVRLCHDILRFRQDVIKNNPEILENKPFARIL